MITLFLNGEPREVSATSLGKLIEELSLPAPLLLVEHNGRALCRSEWPSVILSDGDRLEMMQVAAGG
jgi:thiamine biosynthesis protein ThiS